MICRMNKRQREALIELIQAMINAHETGDSHDTLRRLEAEQDFHRCFECQSEDDLDHAPSA